MTRDRLVKGTVVIFAVYTAIMFWTPGAWALRDNVPFNLALIFSTSFAWNVAVRVAAKARQ